MYQLIDFKGFIRATLENVAKQILTIFLQNSFFHVYLCCERQIPYIHKQSQRTKGHKDPLFLFFVHHYSDKHSVQESSVEATRMKLILVLIILTSSWCFVDGASSADRKSIHGGSDSANKLFRNARRVQQNYNNYGANNGGGYGGYGGYGGGGGGGGGGEKDNWFLADYSLKMISCIPGEQSVNYERGQLESSTIIFRLCPKDYCGVSNSTTMGCDSGYGDFAVGINTFAEAYTESVRDSYSNNMQYYSYQYGEFNVEEYVRECRLFEGGQGGGGGGGGGNNNYYSGGGYSYDYLGPACTADGTDIRLAAFKDPVRHFIITAYNVALEEHVIK